MPRSTFLHWPCWRNRVVTSWADELSVQSHKISSEIAATSGRLFDISSTPSARAASVAARANWPLSQATQTLCLQQESSPFNGAQPDRYEPTFPAPQTGSISVESKRPQR